MSIYAFAIYHSSISDFLPPFPLTHTRWEFLALENGFCKAISEQINGKSSEHNNATYYNDLIKKL